MEGGDKNMKLFHKSKLFVMLTLVFIIALVTVLPASAASTESSDDPYRPKYVEVTKIINFKDENSKPIPPSVYYHSANYSTGRYAGTLNLENPFHTFYNKDGSGYHVLVYKGYIYHQP